MDSSAPEDWETLAGCFSLGTYDFTPTNQLSHQPQEWQVEKIHSQPENLDQNLPRNPHEDPNDCLDNFSDDERDFAMETITEPGGILDEDGEDIDEEHLESVSSRAFHGLPLLSELPSDFQPLNGLNHIRQWQFPTSFGTTPRVNPPQQCTNHCDHAR